ncbi:MAG: helicase-related protein [Butyricimonas paravirosa]
MDYRNLEEGYEHVMSYFAPLGYSADIVHGKLKPAEKEEHMRRFVSGETRILVATTVIEVGVNVPNASIMVIESAERFGLSQLHQLRGRVGRGAEQSYCILMTSYKLSNESRKRIETMTSTNDGFEIAEVDLKLAVRETSKNTTKRADLQPAGGQPRKDGRILNEAAQAATIILEDDPLLQKEENQTFATQVKRLFKTKINWRYIS